jgi:hypothetical protein
MQKGQQQVKEQMQHQMQQMQLQLQAQAQMHSERQGLMEAELSSLRQEVARHSRWSSRQRKDIRRIARQQSDSTSGSDSETAEAMADQAKSEQARAEHAAAELKAAKQATAERAETEQAAAEHATAEQAIAEQAAAAVATAEKAAAIEWQAQHTSQLNTLQSQQAVLHAQYTQLTDTDADTITVLQAHIALEVKAAVNQRLQQLRTSESACCEGDSASEPIVQQPVLDPEIQSHIESTVNIGLHNWLEEIKQRILDWSTAESEITEQRVQQQVHDYLAAFQNGSGGDREHTAQLSNEQQTDLQSAQCTSDPESHPTSVTPDHSQMTAVQQYLQAQIGELDERLTEMQSVHNNNSPEPQLSVQTNRLRRKGTQYHQQERQRQLTQQQERQLAQKQNKWHRPTEQPVWTVHILSAEQQALRAQCKELELRLRESVEGCGTVAERMVQQFRAALHGFEMVARAHTLRTVASAISRELRDDQHSDSPTREYSQTASKILVHGTGNAMTPAQYRSVPGMVDTTVGTVLDKLSTQWYQKRPMHSMWLHWREKHLRAARLIAVHAMAAAPAQGNPSMPQTTEQLSAPVQVPTAEQPSETLTGSAEQAAAEGVSGKASSSSAKGATAGQSYAPDNSGCSVQLMAAFTSMHRVWEHNWDTVVTSDRNENSKMSLTADFPDSDLVELHQRSRAMVNCEEALQQLQGAQHIQCTTMQRDTPMQLIQQCHPTEATAFKQATEEEVSKAGEEVSKRSARLAELEPEFRGAKWKQRAKWDTWQQRAQETAVMAHRFRQAAADAVVALEVALSSQEWDHKAILKTHYFELARMEAEHTSMQDELQTVDPALGHDGLHSMQYRELSSKAKTIQTEMQTEELHKSKTQEFMRKIRSMVNLEQFRASRKSSKCSE